MKFFINFFKKILFIIKWINHNLNEKNGKKNKTNTGKKINKKKGNKLTNNLIRVEVHKISLN